MSTWTFKARSAAGALALAVLAGCLPVAPNSGPPVSRAVLADRVVVQGPDGYCIDKSATRSSRSEAFVLMASCAAISGIASTGAPFVPTLIGVSVREPEPSDVGLTTQLSTLDSYFRSDAGQAALSLDGDARDVDVVSGVLRNDTYLLHVRIAEKGRKSGVAADQWRAVFAVNGQMVSVSVFALPSHRISASSGTAILRATVQRIRAASANAG